MRAPQAATAKNDDETRVKFMDDWGNVLAIIHRDELDPSRTQFKEGNQAAAKNKWTVKRLQNFANELRTFRNMIGFNYSEMGRALGVTGQYVKMIERAERQPSDKFVKLFRKLKATPALNGERVSAEAVEHLGEIWSHILARRFKCPGCAREVRQGKRHKGLEYWYAATPNQKYCPDHQNQTKRRKK